MTVRGRASQGTLTAGKVLIDGADPIIFAGTTDDIPEGASQKYFTADRVLAAIKALSLTPTGLLIADADGLPATPAGGPTWDDGTATLGFQDIRLSEGIAGELFIAVPGVLGTGPHVAILPAVAGAPGTLQSVHSGTTGDFVSTLIGLLGPNTGGGVQITAGTESWEFNDGSIADLGVQQAGALIPLVDDHQDIGVDSPLPLRPRTIRAATSVVTPLLEGAEIATPDAPSDGVGRLYFKDAGGGKTGLYVRFPTGAEQQIKVEA